jgi:hypothetical protein
VNEDSLHGGDRHADDRSADDRVLARLRELGATADPVPASALLAARSALAYLRMDAELAELVHDSSEDRELVGVRGAADDPRLLSFHSGVAQVELEVVTEGSRRRLIGQCLPATVLTVTVRQPAVELTTTTDDLGRFTMEVPAAPVSLRCIWPLTDQVIETSWVRL